MKKALPERDVCPVCRHLIDDATGVTDREATVDPGDPTVCVYCASFLRFGERLELIEMSLEDIAKLPDNIRRQLVRVREALQEHGLVEPTIDQLIACAGEALTAADFKFQYHFVLWCAVRQHLQVAGEKLLRQHWKTVRMELLKRLGQHA